MASGTKPGFWKNALLRGVAVGIVMSLYSALGIFIPEGGLRAVYRIVEAVILVALLYTACRTRAGKYGDAGFTFADGFSYVLAMMLFAGAVLGLWSYVSAVWFPRDGEAFPLGRTIFFGVLNMVIYGGVAGLFVAAFAKRPPARTGQKTGDDGKG